MSHDNHLKNQLDRSVDQLSPELEQQLAARISLAKSQSRRSNRRIGYALAPVALAVTVWFGIMNESGLTQEEQNLYDDLEYLIAQDELGFLEEMDVSDWIIEPETNTETSSDT